MEQINCKEVVSQISNFIRFHCKNKKAVVGLSGGIDSAVIAKLCLDALGKKNVILVAMPTKNQDTKLQQIFADKFKVTFETAYIDTTWEFLTNNIVKGNFIARMRMAALYAFANKKNGIVVGTTNKSEWLTGYFTKYGDGGVDIEPIINLYKTRVYQLAKYLCIPKQIINAKPTAGLWPGQTDEKELGITYKKLDEILCDMLDKYFHHEQLCKKYGRAKVRRVAELYAVSEHKRLPIPGCAL